MSQLQNPHRGDDSVGAYSIGERKKRAGWLWPLLALLGLLLIGLLLWALLHGRGAAKPAVASKPAPTASASATTPAVTPSSSATASASSTDTSTDAGAGAGAATAMVGGGGVAAHSATGAQAGPGHLGSVLFATDSAALTADSRKVIDAAAAAIKAKGPGTVTVTGYADVLGHQPINTTITKLRATHVASALKTALGSTTGITIKTAAKGQKNPVASNKNAAGRQQNRRAEITFG